jgi:hypothetical protein
MSETRILIRLLRNWEFGSALSKLWNLGGGVNPTKPLSVRHWLLRYFLNHFEAVLVAFIFSAITSTFYTQNMMYYYYYYYYYYYLLFNAYDPFTLSKNILLTLSQLMLHICSV